MISDITRMSTETPAEQHHQRLHVVRHNSMSVGGVGNHKGISHGNFEDYPCINWCVTLQQTDAHETSGQAPGAKRDGQENINAPERTAEDEDIILDAIERNLMNDPHRYKVHSASSIGFGASPARPGTPKQPGSPCIAKGAINKPSNLNGRARPTNNQLLYVSILFR